MRSAALAAVVVGLLAWGAATLRAPEGLVRTPQLDKRRRESTPDATGDWFEVVTRDSEACTIIQGVRVGTPGWDPKYPGGVPPHRHTNSTEQFIVTRGTMGYSVNGRLGTAPKGSIITIPKGAPHFFFNAEEAQDPASASDLVVRFTLSPCGTAPAFFENLAGLSYDAGGRHNVSRVQLLQLMADHGLEPAAVPWPLWRLLAPVVSPGARLLGYRSSYPEYSAAA